MDYLISIADQLAPQLRSMRKARRLNQYDLAVKLGVSQSRIAAIERNPSAVGVGQLIELLKILGVDLILRDTQTHSSVNQTTSCVSDNLPQGEW
jgi:HTH-type transcriptional regulator/antitoxin HipB